MKVKTRNRKEYFCYIVTLSGVFGKWSSVYPFGKKNYINIFDMKFKSKARAKKHLEFLRKSRKKEILETIKHHLNEVERYKLYVKKIDEV